jgi:hypothetical protein
LQRTPVQRSEADVKTDWRERQTKCRWRNTRMSRLSGYSTKPKDGDEHTDVMTDWKGCRWWTHGWQSILDRTSVQGPMSNTWMSRRIGENAIQEAHVEHTADCECPDGVDRTPARRTMVTLECQDGFKEKGSAEDDGLDKKTTAGADDERTDITLGCTERQPRNRWRTH